MPGQYRVAQSNMQVAVGLGCAGTYNSDMTMGYGTQVFKCLFNPGSSPRVENPPMLPKLNPDLTTNSGPIVDNFCGFSSRTIFDAINPGYVLDKTVQGNLDPAPAAPGTNGRVSPEGGEATYTISFRSSTGSQANLHDPVMYDLLPAIGDTVSIGNTRATPRSASSCSRWAPRRRTCPSNTSTGGEPRVAPRCARRTLAAPTTGRYVHPLTCGDTTALRFAYDGTITVIGARDPPVSEVSYTVSTPETDNGDIAWNSVGTNVFAGDDLTGRRRVDSGRPRGGRGTAPGDQDRLGLHVPGPATSSTTPSR